MTSANYIFLSRLFKPHMGSQAAFPCLVSIWHVAILILLTFNCAQALTSAYREAEEASPGCNTHPRISAICRGEVVRSTRHVGRSRGMDGNSQAAADILYTADRLNASSESSLAADAWQREYFSVLPELDDLARCSIALAE